MKFITSLLALAILTFSSAVIIPEGTPDGLYGGMAGSDKIVLLRNITAEDTEPGAVLRPRGFALSKRLENPRVNCDNYLVDQVLLWYQARDVSNIHVHLQVSINELRSKCFNGAMKREGLCKEIQPGLLSKGDHQWHTYGENTIHRLPFLANCYSTAIIPRHETRKFPN